MYSKGTTILSDPSRDMSSCVLIHGSVNRAELHMPVGITDTHRIMGAFPFSRRCC